MTKISTKISLKKFLQISLLSLAIFSNVGLVFADAASDSLAAKAAADAQAALNKTAADAGARGYSSFSLKYLKSGDQGQSYFCATKGADGQPNCTAATTSSNPLASFILQIINFITITVGSLSFLAVVVGGFMIMSSAGNETQVKQGKDILTNALIGLVITLIAYFVIAFVQSLLFETIK